MISYGFLTKTGTLWNGLVNTLFDIVHSVVSLLLAPLNVILNGILGDNITEFISNSATAVNNMFVHLIGFVSSILPSTFIAYLIFIIDFELLWLAGQITYYSFMLLFRWIKEIKFW